MGAVGVSVPRKEAPEKVTGTVRYNDDTIMPGLLRACWVTSLYAHARIRSIDTSEALEIPGVVAVVTGEHETVMWGPVMDDRPILARDKVRYFGEPVAVVVAHSEAEAMRGVEAVKVEYEPLPVVHTVYEALGPDAVLLHEQLGEYMQALPKEVFPEPGTNIGHRGKIRKGDMAKGWAEADVVVEGTYTLPQMDHIAMEARSAIAQVTPAGDVELQTTTQAPHDLKQMVGRYFMLEDGKVNVVAPLVGGAFGGKAMAQLEPVAIRASEAAGGRPVKLVNTREQDITTSPVGMGLEAKIKLGAKSDGTLVAAELLFLMDAGAYMDSAPEVAKALIQDGTGPYNIPNVWCDALCVYTNHIFTTALRGFGHCPATFVIERTIDKLAYALGVDPLQLRRINAIKDGDLSPTQVRITRSNVGDLPQCIDRLHQLINWGEGTRIDMGNGKVRAKGISCFWKTSSSPPDAISSAVVLLNKNGGVRLSVGAVEFGPGTKTTLAQILAERMRMDVDRVHVHMHVNTQADPDHWKTVASMSTFMVGNAVLEAADDAIRQIKDVAGIAMRCPERDLEVADERVFVKGDPSRYVEFKDIVHSYKFPDGNAVGGPIIGRGKFVMRHLTPPDRETGHGKPGPGWTVGAQAVEVELDTEELTYKILRAATVLDAGRVINPMGARGVVMGGMCMGLGYGSRECIMYGESAEIMNPQLRTYKVMRPGEQPEYLVDFVEEPWLESPYGARGFGEHGILGMPGALGNALSAAAEVNLDQLPITPERIWRSKGGMSL